MAPFVILDRDGVINADSPDYIKSASEWLPLPGSVEAIARLTAAGCQVFVATNQAGIARGKLSLAALEAIHQRMIAEVADAGGLIVDIQYCPHHPDDQCQCRKPQPGMLLTLAARHDLDLREGYFVGDSAKDLEAAAAAELPDSPLAQMQPQLLRLPPQQSQPAPALRPPGWRARAPRRRRRCCRA